jgi:hypothetical protein
MTTPLVLSHQLEVKERWLRKELRATRKLIMTQLQWAVTVLAATELNLYYIRRDIRQHLVDEKIISPIQLVPFFRWFLGTLFLIVLAYIFSRYSSRLVKRHEMYRKQLHAMNPSYSGIDESIPVGGKLAKIFYYLFYAFPLFDLIIWILFYAGTKLSITIPF